MRLLIGVSGGIAAYKALETARLAVSAGHAVRVIQTPASERFVGRASFAAITGAPVLGDEFEQDPARGAYPGDPVPTHTPISHLELAQRADAYLIAPAGANTIAKLAIGAADNLLLAAALAADCPVAVAPAMNNRMYLHLATQANLRVLSGRGVTVIPPTEGALASLGERGIGRLAEPMELLAVCERLAAAVPDGLRGLKVLVTAGGTREPFDSVRYIGNRSSGRMGFALAELCAAGGAQVTLVAANVTLTPPPGVAVVHVETAAEMAQACEERFPGLDVLLMAAAVADFRPTQPLAHKLKKTNGQAPRQIELETTPDILAGLAAQRNEGQLLIGFAAEHGEDALAYGREKLARKRVDAIVVNDISRPEIGFDSPDNEVVILAADGAERHVARATKRHVAAEILAEVIRLREAAGAPTAGGA